LAAKLSLTIDASYGKSHYAEMATSVLSCDGAVLVAWQHQEIALTAKMGGRGSARNLAVAARPNDRVTGSIHLKGGSIHLKGDCDAYARYR
jgi:hypothetical protein